MHPARYYLKRAFLLIIFLGMIAYTFYQVRSFIAGPKIIITSPRSGSATTTQVITVEGSTSIVSKITLNGRQIFTDQERRFRERLPLNKGYTIITVSVEDRFGRTATEHIELAYTPLDSAKKDDSSVATVPPESQSATSTFPTSPSATSTITTASSSRP